MVMPARRGLLLGIAAAASFGVSAPLAKRLLHDVEPQMLAGLLYLGAFWALALVPRRHAREAPLQRADLPRLGVVIAFGGIAAPVLLLLGLQRVSGVAGSLLLNLEGVFTILLGVTLFREHLSRRASAGCAVIFGGAVVLGLSGGDLHADAFGVALIALACAAWGVDNNVTQGLSLHDPRRLVQIKAGVAGLVNISLALLIGNDVPAMSTLLAAFALGGLSYGLSVYWDALALRELGAAREAGIFAIAPFVGALVAPLVLPESLGANELVAGALMAVGVWFLLHEQHGHVHRHDSLVHEHVHTHDAHHAHRHTPGADESVPHSHRHEHEPLVHTHEHVSDAHHRHSH
ncbi:MAG: EamA family transporter [Acidimicrobiia bacterium]